MTKEEVDIVLTRTKEIIEFNGYKFCSKYSLLFENSNEMHKKTADALGGYKNKDILTVTASGEQYLSAIIEEAKSVTLYDINLLSTFYVYLKIGAILALDNYKDFYDFITSNHLEDKYFNTKTLLKIADYIPDYVVYYWERYLKELGKEKLPKIFYPPRNDIVANNIKKYNQTYIKENYNQLRSSIDKMGFPKFITSPIDKLPSILEKNSFDIINTSNIIESILMEEWIMDSYSESTITNWIKFIEKDLSDLLKENGQIVVDYNPRSYNKELIEYKKFKKMELISEIDKEKALILVYKKQ